MKKKLRQLVKQYLVSGRAVKPLTRVLPPEDIQEVARMLSPAQRKAREINREQLYQAAKVLQPAVPDGSAVSSDSSST